ncbi:TetM/TetW/TetO/TetS family tetracycline resistance ribosomal protection protein [Amycolatopsis mongoliensis]|uniref:TetM/TetW/TetO/TetS family tetracycline resistance ribosomal protection protein n=1 Tax=Amycolatopsis mongoliensis TaxID=715475 RepID=A0A9Y2JRQ7_9PSEU|nr:TetM/TetW/TetO/TetS family tetracycline resistance ribosomal protection protein [Amycolatopsis sp. 4-36]WIY03463.1 TetM/TetW/TetO/TetS family tetracycline resistance ribosomal protection protein [Amycolatopsis sp. 4-36]
MKTLNIGILAHVDAGKTSLTERLLFEAGAIDHLGSVDRGDTQTDSLELERRRGITIRSAVVSFTTGDTRITLIDTPGHSDFIAEVERALRVLDGAVLVVSAVEGVQAQTRVLMRTLRRLGIPTLIFVNKIDRPGARDLLDEIRAKLAPRAIALNAATASDELAELLADGDDAFLESYVEGRVDEPGCRTELARQVARGALHPVLSGSAITGAGVAGLVTAMAELLPAAERTGDGPLHATVFKIDRGRAGEKIAYARLHSGSLAPRQRISFYRGETELTGRVTAIEVTGDDVALAGDVARVRGLRDVRIGDRLGSPGTARDGVFAPPSLETVVRPVRPEQAAALFTALTRLSEEDPLIDVRRHGHDISVRLYGEVQKEVLRSLLADGAGIDVTFERTRTLYVEKPVGRGEAVEELDPEQRLYFFATVGLRVEPGPGVTFGLSVELGSLPLAFHKAIEETVHTTLEQGLHGWEVLDVAVTLTHTAFFSPLSAAGDFRKMTPLVLMAALKQAGTRVHEPVHRFELEVPANAVSAVLLKLAELRAVPGEPVIGASSCTLHGTIPAEHVHAFEQALPALSQGEGVFLSEFEDYRPCPGPPPTRPRTGQNPLDRKEYLAQVARR